MKFGLDGMQALCERLQEILTVVDSYELSVADVLFIASRCMSTAVRGLTQHGQKLAPAEKMQLLGAQIYSGIVNEYGPDNAIAIIDAMILGALSLLLESARRSGLTTEQLQRPLEKEE